MLAVVAFSRKVMVVIMENLGLCIGYNVLAVANHYRMLCR